MRWMVNIRDLMEMTLNKLQDSVMNRDPDMLQSISLQRIRQDLATKLNWKRCIYTKQQL